MDTQLEERIIDAEDTDSESDESLKSEDTDSESDESLESEDEMECWCCEETKMRKEFCDHKDEKGRTCLSCDDKMINCNECGNCPTMFYKDAVEIDDYWYCKECAKNL